MTQPSPVPSAAADLPTSPTGSSLQRLADRARERDAGRSELHFEGRMWTSAQLADRSRRLSGGLRTAGVACEVRIVDAIPLTSVLKTDRKLLRAQLRAESAS